VRPFQPINRTYQQPYQQPYQNEAEHRYLLFSFVMLLVVIGIILLILFYLSTLGGGPF
jgi:hypothetical protein